MNQYLLKEDLKHPFRYGLLCLIATSVSLSSFYSIGALADDEPVMDTMCYAVADNDKRGASEDVLVRSYLNGRTEEVGLTGTLNMEAVAFDVTGKVFYAAAEAADGSDGARLGTIDLDTGVFKPIGNGIGIGTGNGEEGPITFDDIDGLAFDFGGEGFLYGTHRREHRTPQQYDLLIQINPYTGQFIPDAFGPGQDYVVVKIEGNPQYYDIDDIASDPADGTLYIVANTGNGVTSVLATLEKADGKPTGVAKLVGSNAVDDIESLAFERIAKPDGTFRLYGTTGNGGHNKHLDPTAKNRIYEINKTTGAAASLGRLKQPEQPQQDYEALSCRTEMVPPNYTCLMYAVHDEGQYDSQMIEIDPFAGSGIGAISPLGPLYPRHDLEGLAIHPNTGKLYATSGSDQVTGIPNGAVYEVNRDNGLITKIGLTGFCEVSAFAVRETDSSLWGWSRGGNRTQCSPTGPILIDPDAADKNNMGTLVKAFPFEKPGIQAIAWSNDSQKLYGTVATDTGTDLYAYDYNSKDLNLICKGALQAEIEGMEMQPDGLLLLSTHHKNNIGIVAYDPEACEVVASRTFKNVPEYYDLESLEWPAKECSYRSWLYATSGDAEIDVIEYDMVPQDVQEAVLYALGMGNASPDDFGLETDGDTITLYVGSVVYVVRPAIYSQVRSGVRAGQVSEAELLDIPGSACKQLVFENRTSESWKLCPVAGNEGALQNALNPFGSVTIDEDGNVVIKGSNGSVLIQGQLSLNQEQPTYPAGQAIPPATTDTAELKEVADQNGDGTADYEITYPNNWKQWLFIQG
jgi:hypothetical protein